MTKSSTAQDQGEKSKQETAYFYSDHKEPKLTELISVQFQEDNGDFSQPTFHYLPFGQERYYCQFLANSTKKKVRMTRPDRVTEDVSVFNGSYFDAQ